MQQTIKSIFFTTAAFFILQANALAKPIEETENPNNTSGTAQLLDLSSPVVLKGNIFPDADIDFYSFQAQSGDKIYAMVQTASNSGSSTDSQIRIFGTDGSTLLEFDDDNGTQGALASSISGLTIPAAGTYFLRINHFAATTQLNPYFLYIAKQSSVPSAEAEPNDTIGAQNSLPISRTVSGSLSGTSDVDLFSVNVNEGDTVFASLDLDPERDGSEFSGQLLNMAFGSTTFITSNDNGDSAANSPDSEATVFTAKASGVYTVGVSSSGATFGNYILNVFVIPADSQTGCFSFSTGNLLQPLTDMGTTTIPLFITSSPDTGRLSVDIVLSHSSMADLDVSLVAPDGQEVVLFTDIGNSAETNMIAAISDSAASPIGISNVVSGYIFQPESRYRLSWFNGKSPNGTWSLKIRDDAAGNTGTLVSWGLKTCPADQLSCGLGKTSIVAYTTGFEGGTGGFTHSGTQDEWALGLPSAAPINTCNSGSNCWKTDLTGTYNASSDQTLVSPSIDLTNYLPPYQLVWAQKYQMEGSDFDTYDVTVEDSANAGNFRTVFRHLDATMEDAAGNPTETVRETAGWGTYIRDFTSLGAESVIVKFKVTSDSTINQSGVAIDDFSIYGCTPDADNDGTADSLDSCPNDPGKNAPGICGCAVADNNNDGDSLPDCNETCPLDPAKLAPGICGCGVADADANANGITDCKFSDELRSRIDALKSTVSKLKLPKNSTASSLKKLRAAKKNVNNALTALRNYYAQFSGSITPVPGKNLQKLLNDLNKKVKIALKQSSTFAKDKSAGLKSISTLRKNIA